MRDIRDRWPLADHLELRDRLVEAYDEPHRGYHDLRHLEEVLERIQHILTANDENARVDRDAVLLAAWFHDAVYDRDGDNEERSARLAEEELPRAGTRRSTVAEVARLVRLTATHSVGADDVNGAVLCDADLGILAADQARYDEYVAGVRQEYAHIPDAEFRTSRAAVLRRLVETPHLFMTQHGRGHWEARARANVERELATLLG